MNKFRVAIQTSVFVILVLATCTLVQAQATRTWVSGVGDDVNPCSRTAPCKTFAGAISKTATNGEINCLDPAGYGAVTVTKSITIDCEDTQGSILAAGTFPLAVWLISHPPVVVVAAAAASGAFIIYRHRDNLTRLREGSEHVFSFGGSGK